MKNGPRGYEKKKKINYELTFILACRPYRETSTVSNSYSSYSLKILQDSHVHLTLSIYKIELLEHSAIHNSFCVSRKKGIDRHEGKKMNTEWSFLGELFLFKSWTLEGQTNKLLLVCLWEGENRQQFTEALFLLVCWILFSYKLNMPCKSRNIVRQLVD